MASESRVWPVCESQSNGDVNGSRSDAGLGTMRQVAARTSNRSAVMGRGVRPLSGGIVLFQFARASLFAGAWQLLRNSAATEDFGKGLCDRSEPVFVHFFGWLVDRRRCYRPYRWIFQRGGRTARADLSRYNPTCEDCPVRRDWSWEFRCSIFLVSLCFSQWAKDPSSGERLALVGQRDGCRRTR